ncbi:MAG: GNAT family N-acetyltransferase [Desulfitobacteriaceae bacterium]|nr:GNAT family N-acetyltransferase [Desulfitobacteriaceae bacterium]
MEIQRLKKRTRESLYLREGGSLISLYVVCVINVADIGYNGYNYEGSIRRRIAYCRPDSMTTRLTEGISFCLVAIFKQKIIVMIEVRNGNHIGLLFVDDCYHNNGIAKNLVSLAIEKSKATEIDVNSSLYAVNIYKRMGFEQFGDEQMRGGIRLIPMKKSIIT